VTDGIGHAHHRQALFGAAQAGLRQVLIGSRDMAEPRVVGDQQQEIGTRVIATHILRKDPFVADERQRGAQASHVDNHRSRPGGIPEPLIRGEPIDPEPTEEITKRHVFAERHKVMLVVKRGHLARLPQPDERVVIAQTLEALDAQNHGRAARCARNRL
jgi:hypothetical protein